MEKVKAACLALKLDGLVLLGGCRTATGGCAKRSDKLDGGSAGTELWDPYLPRFTHVYTHTHI